MSNANVYYSVDYAHKNDEELIEIIRDGNKYALEHLIDRYKGLVNMKVGKYYIIGAERETRKKEIQES